MGQQQPRGFPAGAADVGPITDIRANSRRNRFGPLASCRSAEKAARLFACALHDRPRFPALAHFRRRPPERVDGLGMPASENLDMSGLSGQVNFLAGSTIKTLDRG